ncbi:MAG: hypothetical protein Q8O34_11415 [Rhodocyclaceae bacterium]|nr:hypothetical protein [Rhodocyclaceae bacterium]
MRTVTMALTMAGAILCNGIAFASCNSDFECGYGNKCVKAPGDTTFL